MMQLLSQIFQSTLPLQGATFRQCQPGHLATISIHAPLAGSDMSAAAAVANTVFIFQSTLPLQGATQFPEESVLLIDISIHAPLAGSDQLSSPQH